jgi:hypothetical protein
MIALGGLSNRLSARVTERFDEFGARYAGEVNATELHAVILAVCDFVHASVSGRDGWSVVVKHAEDPVAIDLSSVAACTAALAGLDRSDADPYATSIDITIEKNVVGGVLSVYSVDAFAAYLADGPLQDVARSLALRLSGILVLECQCDNVRGGTRTIQFAPKGEIAHVEPVEESSRLHMLGLFRDSGHTDLHIDPLVPADVGLREKTDIERIDRFFDQLSVLVAVTYLANRTWMTGAVIHYRMAGYKVIDGTIPAGALLEATPALVQIAQWCYADGGQSDKVGLARNVISIHVNHLNELGSRPEVWHALLSNYQIYLKQNVESYLALKGRLSDMLMDASARTQALAGTVLDALRNGIYVLLTFLLTVVVVNAVKDISVTAVFSVPYLVIALITCLLLSAWVGAAAWHAIREYDSGAEALEQVVAENYGTMLSAGELGGALQPSAARNRGYLVAHLRRHLVTWFSIVLCLLFSLFVAHMFLASETQMKQSANPPVARAETVSSPESGLSSSPSRAYASHAPWPGFDQAKGLRPLEVK